MSLGVTVSDSILRSGPSLECSVDVLSDPSQIAALESLRFLKGIPGTSRPRFLLASTMRPQWIPRAVVVRSGGQVLGLAYFKERRFGVATGVLYADFSLGSCVTAPPDRREFVLESALSHVLAKTAVRGLRLRISPDGFEIPILRRLAADRGAQLNLRDESYHAILHLPGAYEDFLGSLGYKARRNFRYYRRRFENGGHRYVDRIDLSEFGRISRRLRTRGVVGASDEGITRSLNMFAELDHPLLAGLRRNDGEWVAIIGGWVEDGLPVVFFQMNNDQDYPTDSLCVVLRGYFFERLIQQGYPQVAFWAGIGEPFLKAATFHPSVSAFLDVQTRGWRAFRGIVRKLGPYLPVSVRYGVDWITPAGKP